MKKYGTVIKRVLFALVLLVLLFEIIRDSQRQGDFMGYVNAGNAVLNQTPIYADYLNTWPPFFSIVSIPIAVLHNFNFLFVRVLWLVSIVVVWFFILKVSVKMLYKLNLVFKRNGSNDIELTDWRVFLPFILTFRFLIEEMQNIQINSFLLLICLYSIYFLLNKRPILSGILIGLAVSIKVYPIFLLLFFVWQRQFKSVVIGLITIGVSVGLCFLVFGFNTTIQYHSDWLTHKAMGQTIFNFKNQSAWPWLQAFFTHESRGLNIYYNIFDLGLERSKKVTMLLIAVASIYPLAKLFLPKKSAPIFSDFAFVLAATPILSPLAWKYYFVFLFPLILVLHKQLFSDETAKSVKYIYYVALSLLILSTEGLIGKTASDIAEIFGAVTIGTLLLLGIFLQFKSSQN
ncbi:MAG: DUF2029 domain-containing protein [Flavobacteriales bacterium]|nr:DUF2029 domain-containing protein [Flavobacteriales bacterium]